MFYAQIQLNAVYFFLIILNTFFCLQFIHIHCKDFFHNCRPILANICGLASIVFPLYKNFANQNYKGNATLLQLLLHKYIIL